MDCTHTHSHIHTAHFRKIITSMFISYFSAYQTSLIYTSLNLHDYLEKYLGYEGWGNEVFQRVSDLLSVSRGEPRILLNPEFYS